MMFMQFRIGFDMGLILIKAICFSLLSVFTLMPGLLILFSKAMEKTQHRNFVPSIERWGRFAVKARYVSIPIFAVCLILGFWMSNQCPYVYGYSQLHNQPADVKVKLPKKRFERPLAPRISQPSWCQKGITTARKPC